MKRLVLLMALACGCSPTLSAISAPPLGKIADLDDANDRIHVSLGVALAFECVSNGPCAGASASIDDDDIANVRSAAMDEVGYGGTHGPRARSVFVVAGREVGETRLHLKSADGDRDLRVVVHE